MAQSGKRGEIRRRHSPRTLAIDIGGTGIKAVTLDKTGAPLAFLVEQAGGRASTGTRRILDIEAESVHQQVPLVIGSAGEVSLFEKFLVDGHPS